MSFDAPRATFGLGELTAATRAVIRWPDGARQRIATEADRRVVVVQQRE